MESDNLSKILKTLSEETTSDGHLKFSGKTIRDISQAIVCRTYGKSCLELAYLLIIASACERRGGSFLDLTRFTFEISSKTDNWGKFTILECAIFGSKRSLLVVRVAGT